MLFINNYQFTFGHYKKIKHLLGDVFHHFELSSGCVDLGDGARLQFVHELAKHGTILNDIFEGLLGGELSTKYTLDPFFGFILLFRVALGSELPVTR